MWPSPHPLHYVRRYRATRKQLSASASRGGGGRRKGETMFDKNNRTVRYDDRRFPSRSRRSSVRTPAKVSSVSRPFDYYILMTAQRIQRAGAPRSYISFVLRPSVGVTERTASGLGLRTIGSGSSAVGRRCFGSLSRRHEAADSRRVFESGFRLGFLSGRYFATSRYVRHALTIKTPNDPPGRTVIHARLVRAFTEVRKSFYRTEFRSGERGKCKRTRSRTAFQPNNNNSASKVDGRLDTANSIWRSAGERKSSTYTTEYRCCRTRVVFEIGARVFRRLTPTFVRRGRIVWRAAGRIVFHAQIKTTAFTSCIAANSAIQTSRSTSPTNPTDVELSKKPLKHNLTIIT